MSEWQPIETAPLPKEGESWPSFLVLMERRNPYEEPLITSTMRTPSGGFCTWSHIVSRITHWMPIPSPPDKGQTE